MKDGLNLDIWNTIQEKRKAELERSENEKLDLWLERCNQATKYGVALAIVLMIVVLFEAIAFFL